jgi:hypothetical protein
MKKLTLDLDELEVVSYETGGDDEALGTVHGNALTTLCSRNTVSCDGSCMVTCDTCTPC